MNFMNDLGMSFFVVVIVLLEGEVLVWVQFVRLWV